MPVTGAPSDNTTLVSVLQEFGASGHPADFGLGDGPVLRCPQCDHETADVIVDRTRRLEGASDPADMAMVVAVRCPRCDAAGTAVLRFGPEASAEEGELLRSLDERDAEV